MKRKVLLALADPSAGERLRLGLEEAGYEVAQHRNGKETVRYLEDEFPDLVLLGTDLPDLSAGKFCSRLAGLPPTRSSFYCANGTRMKS